MDIYENCTPCDIAKGMNIDETGHCVCALDRGLVIDERGRCVCPVEHGYKLTSAGECVPDGRIPSGCTSDSDCANNRYCDLDARQCRDPCEHKECGINAICNATNHQAVCQCITGYIGNPDKLCSKC